MAAKAFFSLSSPLSVPKPYSPSSTAHVAGLAVITYVVTRHPLWLLGVPLERPLHCPVAYAPSPHLILCTHDYEHIDLFVMASEIRQWRRTSRFPVAFVVGNHIHNKLFCEFVHCDRTCIPVKGGTTQKIMRMLKTHHVVLFFYRNAPHTGPFYLSKAASNVTVAKISVQGAECATLLSGKRVGEVVNATLGRRAKVSYEPLRANVHSTPSEFIQKLKSQLYEGNN